MVALEESMKCWGTSGILGSWHVLVLDLGLFCDYSLNCTLMICASYAAAAAAAKLLQSCPTLRDPIDSSPPGSPVPGILQARTLGWVAISFSNA